MSQKITIADAKELVLQSLSKPLARRQLITKCVESLDFPSEVLKNKSPDSAVNYARGVLGQAIEQLKRNGYLQQDDNGIVSLASSKQPAQVVDEVKRDTKIEKILLDLLSVRALDKKTALSKTVETYLSKYGKEKQTTIHADAGRLLSNFVKAGTVVKDNGSYIVVSEKSFIEDQPLQEVQQAVAEQPSSAQSTAKSKDKSKQKTKQSAKQIKTEPKAKPEKKVVVDDETHNRMVFAQLSPEQFVNCTVDMFMQYFKYLRYANVTGKVTEGSDDGGIDGVITMTDDLCHNEQVIMQMKHYTSSRRKYVPEVEIREFIGVLSASPKATRGLFVSNYDYSSNDKQLVKSYTYKYLATVSGKQWLELAKRCGYRIPDRE